MFCVLIDDGSDQTDCEMARAHLADWIDDPLRVAAELSRYRDAARRSLALRRRESASACCGRLLCKRLPHFASCQHREDEHFSVHWRGSRPCFYEALTSWRSAIQLGLSGRRRLARKPIIGCADSIFAVASL
jgi:hypothetical protein